MPIQGFHYLSTLIHDSYSSLRAKIETEQEVSMILPQKQEPSRVGDCLNQFLMPLAAAQAFTPHFAGQLGLFPAEPSTNTRAAGDPVVSVAHWFTDARLGEGRSKQDDFARFLTAGGRGRLEGWNLRGQDVE
jgi:hypothetical protein